MGARIGRWGLKVFMMSSGGNGLLGGFESRRRTKREIDHVWGQSENAFSVSCGGITSVKQMCLDKLLVVYPFWRLGVQFKIGIESIGTGITSAFACIETRAGCYCER